MSAPTPSTQWSENKVPKEQLERWVAEVLQFQANHAKAESKPLDRTFHPKGFTLGGKSGTVSLTLRDDLPAWAQRGFFQPGARFDDVLVRLSIGSGRSDRAPGPRGFVIEINAPNGERQDFLCIDSETVPARNADQFMGIFRAAERSRNPLVRLVYIGLALGPSAALRLVQRIRQSQPVRSYATHKFYSTTPYRIGQHPIKYAVFAKSAPEVEPASGRDFLKEDLKRRLAKGDVTYDLCFQPYTSEVETPINDPTVPWPTPFIPVAELRLKQQALEDAPAVEADRTGRERSFSPAVAPIIEPMGDINAVRVAAYYVSAKARGAKL